MILTQRVRVRVAHAVRRLVDKAATQLAFERLHHDLGCDGDVHKHVERGVTRDQSRLRAGRARCKT